MRILSVKVNTLVCFMSMVKTLDWVSSLYPDWIRDLLIGGVDQLDTEVGTVISQGAKRVRLRTGIDDVVYRACRYARNIEHRRIDGSEG